MRKSKFWEIFDTLDKKELKEFRNFLQGLYPKQTNSNLLLKYILKNNSVEGQQNLEKNIVLKKVFEIHFPPTAQQRKNLDNILSKLHGYLLEYLLWKKSKQKNISSEFQILEILKERKLDKLYFAKINASIKFLEKDGKPNMWTSLYLMKLNHHTFYHSNYSKLQCNQSVLRKSMQNLDTFFCISKLKIAAEMLNREHILQEKYTIHFLDDVLGYFSKKNKNIYVTLIQFFQQRNEYTYKDLKDFFLKSQDILHPDEQLIIISYLLNYNSSEMKKGNTEAYEKAFELFEFGLDHHIFTQEDGYISSTKFNNIVLVACQVNKTEWVEKFINKADQFLSSKDKINTVKMATAYLLLKKKDHQEVVKTIGSLEFKNDYFSLRARSIVLRSYFELYHKKNKELILNHTKAFSHYLTRNKNINPTTINSYFSLIKITNMLLRKKINIAKIKTELKKMKYIFCKQWLIEKINDLDIE